MKELKPIKETPEDFEQIKLRIERLFREELYWPILALMNQSSNVIKNSVEDLLSAIGSGRIYFYRGQFKGRFNSTVSRQLKKIGAKWDQKQGSFKISLSSLSNEMRLSITMSEDRFLRTTEKISKRLEDMLPEEFADKLNVQDLFDSALFRTNKQFEKTIKGLIVSPKLTTEERAKIAERYSENMKLYIRDFAKEEISELRQKISRSAVSGRRFESMISEIKRSYGVTQNKAKFLARQETNLMLTNFKQARYESAGVNEYKWCTVVGSEGHEVRPYHKKLEGKVFRWDTPPIVNAKGDRCNPGQDFNCRCFARPIVKF